MDVHHCGLEEDLYRIQLEIVSQQNLNEILRIVVERAQKFFDADLVVLFLFDEATGLLEYVMDAGPLVPGDGVGVAIKPSEGAAGEAFSSHEPVFTKHYLEWFDQVSRSRVRASKWEDSDKRYATPDSVMAVPLLRGDSDAIGALTVANAVGSPVFDESYLSRAETFAMLAAIAIQNAHDREIIMRLNQELVESNRKTEEDLSLAENTLYRRNLELIEAAKYAERAQCEERGRIAADIHDNALQYLYGASALLQAAEQTDFSDEGRIRWMIGNARTYIDQSEIDIRESIQNLRDTSIRQTAADFPDALRDYVANAVAGDDLSFGFSCEGDVRVLCSEETEEAVFRIVQEAVRNVLEHARATSVELSMDYGRDELVVQLEDDGVGMDLETVDGNGSCAILKKNHYGLKIMLERAKQVKGQLSIESTPGEGSVVVVSVPCPDGDWDMGR